MNINEAGLALVQDFEGLYLDAYRDPVGLWTIGWGHTGPDAYEGNRVSRRRAEELLADDMSEFERVVSEAVTVPLNPNQFSALVSFSFNVGGGALRRSTMLRLLNQRNYVGAAAEFKRWNKATIDGNKVVLRGLTRRRAAEANLFQTPAVPRAELSKSRTIQAGRAAVGLSGAGMCTELFGLVDGIGPVVETVAEKLTPTLLAIVIVLLFAVLYFRADDHRRGLR